MASITGPIPIIPPAGRSYSSEEWEQMRTDISKLYRDDLRALKDVRTILACHYDFRPTKAMLMKHIRKWDLDKKHKESDMLAALQKALAREAHGKKTTFIIRNRRVTFEEIVRYFKRKGVRDPRALLTPSDNGTSNSKLTCYTPPSSPGAQATSTSPSWEDFGYMHLDVGEVEDLGGECSFVVHTGTEQSPPSSSQRVYTSLPLPDDQGRLQSLLVFTAACNKVYTPPKPIRGGYEFLIQFELLCDMVQGHADLVLSQCHGAFIHFNKAFNSIHSMLKEESPLNLLALIYGLAGLFNSDQNHEILHHLCDFVIQLSGVHVKRARPLEQAMAVLRQMPYKDRAHSAGRALEYLRDNSRYPRNLLNDSVMDYTLDVWDSNSREGRLRKYQNRYYAVRTPERWQLTVGREKKVSTLRFGISDYDPRQH